MKKGCEINVSHESKQIDQNSAFFLLKKYSAPNVIHSQCLGGFQWVRTANLAIQSFYVDVEQEDSNHSYRILALS